jgi:hypothetical protein
MSVFILFCEWYHHPKVLLIRRHPKVWQVQGIVSMAHWEDCSWPFQNSVILHHPGSASVAGDPGSVPCYHFFE